MNFSLDSPPNFHYSVDVPTFMTSKVRKSFVLRQEILLLWITFWGLKISDYKGDPNIVNIVIIT